jgi:hypothetical protein
MIGYILLVTFVIVLGVVMYNWMKTYIPQEDLNCPDGTSLFVQDYSCNSNSLNLTLKNNGKFNVGGYFIYATTSPEQKLATRDLSFYITENYSKLSPNGVKLTGDTNSLKPNQVELDNFDLSSVAETIYAIEIIPIRWQKDGRISRIVSCKDSKVRENLICN